MVVQTLNCVELSRLNRPRYNAHKEDHDHYGYDCVFLLHFFSLDKYNQKVI
jgi:hypothetical protein